MSIQKIIIAFAMAGAGIFSLPPVHADTFPTQLKSITKINTDNLLPTEKESLAINKPANNTEFDKLKNILTQQLHKPYQWGATGPEQFDCSGLVCFAYKKALQIDLPRTAEQQYYQNTPLRAAEVRPGDLVFFSYNHGKSIDHVGIIIDNGHHMIDAQNKGVIIESYLSPWWKTSIAGYARVL